MKLSHHFFFPTLLGLLAYVAAVPVEYIKTWQDDIEEGDIKGFSMRAAAPIGQELSRAGWSVVCDSQHVGNECSKAIDGSDTSFWQTEYVGTTPNLPHTITVNLGSTQSINGISYLPRQDGSKAGLIAQHAVYISSDGTTWGSPVAYGTWYSDSTKKFSNFEPVNARYLRLVALTEAEGESTTSVADLKVYKASIQPATGPGKWGPTLDFPVIPVAGFVNPQTGKVVVWSAWKYDDFHNSAGGYTLLAELDPRTGVISNRRVDNTQHDMFCPGIAMDGNGRVVVTGGNTAARTSIFDAGSDGWTKASDMVMARGYQGSAVGSDGKVFTIGGSWGGERKLKAGEIYDPATNKWTLLSGARADPMLTKDPDGIYKADNHAWLFGWKNQTIFHAGPSSAMNWYYTTGGGDVKPAGKRGSDPDAMCGTAVIFDAVKGKMLTVGGSYAYRFQDATANAHIVTLGEPGDTAGVTKAGSNMRYRRIFANSVVLPNGNVFIHGGQQHSDPFEDSAAVFTPEIYMPSQDKFVSQRANSIPRVYHSIALLLPDGTVLTGGGGLCGSCTTNHFDAQVFTPQALLNADGTPAKRPSIKSSSPSVINPGGSLTFTTDTPIQQASLIRYGTVTHSLNTDQRRVPLVIKSTGTNSYSTAVPSDSGILLPGYWMLFVINSAGVPSMAATIRVTS